MEQGRPCVRDRAALFPTAQQRARFHGARGRSAMEHTLLAPPALQLNASTHSCLSGHVPSGCGLAPLRLASLLRERGDLPDLSMPSALAKATSACQVLLALLAQGQRGAAPGGFACRARAGWKCSPGALFSSHLRWHALAAGGIRGGDKGAGAGKREPALSADREGTDERLACLQHL